MIKKNIFETPEIYKFCGKKFKIGENKLILNNLDLINLIFMVAFSSLVFVGEKTWAGACQCV